MRKAHIAFFLFPHAHSVNPSLSVVAVLVRRGFRVTYVTSKRFAARVTALGAEALLCPPFINRFLETENVKAGPEDRSVGIDFIDLAEDTLSAVTSFYERNRPDVIIYDFACLAGRVLKERWHIPGIQTNSGFAFDRSHLVEQTGTAEHRNMALTECADCDAFLERFSIAGDFLFFRERLNIFFYPEHFQLEGNVTDERVFYAGRCAAEQPYEKMWYPQGDLDRPILLVTTSTYYVQGPEYFKMCIEAAAELPWHVVLAIGDNNSPDCLHPLPAHCEIVQNIPQLQVLAHSDLLICLGGMIVTVEAMYHGVPLLMITHGFSEPELYAENAARLGLGKHLRKDKTSVEGIRNSLLEISRDASLLCRVNQTQRIVQSSPGGEETANRIVEYLATV